MGISAAVLLAFARIDPAAGQCGSADWVDRNAENPPGLVITQAMAYDSARDVTVMFGGAGYGGERDQTWEWDGTTWTQRHPAMSPPPVTGHAMAYDSTRGVTVLFGAVGTWEYNGVTWVQKSSTLNPGSEGASMAYDANRGVCVLLDGDDYGIPVIWEWNGTEWMWQFPEHQPTLRTHAAMVYDAVRQEVLLFGGFDDNGYNQETWSYDGVDWTQKAPIVYPSARRDHAMTFDSARGVVVLFGGIDGNFAMSDTWEWNGTQWAQMTTFTGPAGLVDHPMAFDDLRNVTVLVGGDETWEWNGTQWTLRSQPMVSPGTNFFPALDYDIVRQRTVLFGGLQTGLSPVGSNETWEWDGTTWTQRTPVDSPQGRYHHPLAYDSPRGMSVLYGGFSGINGLLRDTWEWDGTNWLLRSAVSAPGYRANHGLAFDSLRNVTVMFGGFDGNPFPNGQTWEWDGTTWTQRSPATSPAARVDFAMDYDADRHVTVLFGGWNGQNPPTLYGDTWEWDGSNWTQRSPAAAPSVRSLASMAYDIHLNHIVLHGGTSNPFDGGGALDETWTWDGTNWMQLTPPHSPGLRFGSDMAFDVARNALVLYGGFCACSPHSTWEFTGGGGSGDVNGDGSRNGRDIAAFVAILQAGGPPGEAFCAADMNQNGTVNAADVPLFVTAILGG